MYRSITENTRSYIRMSYEKKNGRAAFFRIVFFLHLRAILFWVHVLSSVLDGVFAPANTDLSLSSTNPSLGLIYTVTEIFVYPITIIDFPV